MFIFVWGGGRSEGVRQGEWGGGRGRWMDRRTGPNQFVPSTSSNWGHNNAFTYKLCPWQAQFMTILSFDLQVWPWPFTYVNKYLNGTSTSRRQQLCKIILKSMHKCNKYGPDKLNLWPFWSLFDPYELDLQPMWKMFQLALFLFDYNNYAILFWIPCINVPVMARTSSIYDHFDIFWPLWPWPSTFLKMFKMALLLLKDNSCAKLFLKSMHKCTSYGPDKVNICDHFDLYPIPVTLTFNLPEKKMFQMALFLLKGNNCANLFWNPCINVQVMLRTSSIHVFDHFDLYLTPDTLTFNLPKKKFNWHFSTSRATTEPNCFEIHALLYKLWSGQIRTNALTHGRTLIHRTKSVTTLSHLPASGVDKKGLLSANSFGFLGRNGFRKYFFKCYTEKGQKWKFDRFVIVRTGNCI